MACAAITSNRSALFLFVKIHIFSFGRCTHRGMGHERWWYVLVADFGAIHFQVTMNLLQATPFEFTTISAIKYTTCCAFVLYHCVFFNKTERLKNIFGLSIISKLIFSNLFVIVSKDFFDT